MVRQLTISNLDKVKKYAFLKNGAMYSVLVLGTFMVLGGFGYHVPEWISPIATISILGYFYWKSKKEIQKMAALAAVIP